MQFLYQARNDDEHGLGSSILHVPERNEIGVSEKGYSDTIMLNGGPFKNVTVTGCKTAVIFEGALPPFGITATSLDGRPVLNRRTPAMTALTMVQGRGSDIYPPPTLHKGKDISGISPINAGILALNYLSGIVDEAKSFVSPN